MNFPLETWIPIYLTWIQSCKSWLFSSLSLAVDLLHNSRSQRCISLGSSCQEDESKVVLKAIFVATMVEFLHPPDPELSQIIKLKTLLNNFFPNSPFHGLFLNWNNKSSEANISVVQQLNCGVGEYVRLKGREMLKLRSSFRPQHPLPNFVSPTNNVDLSETTIGKTI